MPSEAVYMFGIVASEGEGYMQVIVALPWWPDEPLQEWIVPGTYRTWEANHEQH